MPSYEVVAKLFGCGQQKLIESTDSPITKAVELSANFSIFEEFDDSRQLQLGRSFVKIVKSLGLVRTPVVPPRESSLS